MNDPNFDGFLPGTTFVGPTRSLFERFTVDYQNDLKAGVVANSDSPDFFIARWMPARSGLLFSQAFGPHADVHQRLHRGNSVFPPSERDAVPGLNLVAGGRYDHFNQFGDVWTYRFAGSYLIPQTETRLHASVATGFSPPSSQDKIFRFNPIPANRWNRWIRWKIWVGTPVSSSAFGKGVSGSGATYFHNDLSNVIGFNGLFETLNLGSAITQGVETEIHVTPIPDLTFAAAYTYLEAEKTSSLDISQPEGASLPRRPRHEIYVSASYLWCKKLRTTIEAKFVNAREEINPMNFGGPNFDIEDYAVVNLAADYEVNKQFSIFGRIENLGNEQYAEVFGFPALGRGAYGGFKVRF